MNPIRCLVLVLLVAGAAPFASSSDMPGPPGGLVAIEWAGEKLTMWPYTGVDFSGHSKDPMNLVFVGEADPVAIRAALMGLDGDRTAFGFPPAPPFNSTWSDAIGDVHTAYADGAGWLGSVVQLQLGSYGPVRFHLRLFRSGKQFGSSGEWTLGAAHFEIMIPGTPEHQVIGWELAEQIVVADLSRSGLLAAPPASTGVINEQPLYRTIPAPIYNGLPEELKAACGLPPGSATDDVPIPTDGKGTILHVGESVAAVPDEWTQVFSVPFDQVIAKPFCAGDGGEFVLVQGPVSLSKTVRVGESGDYEYSSSLLGHVTVTPVDITQSPPLPVGDPYRATIGDQQFGFLSRLESRVTFDVKRVAPQDGGTELFFSWLNVSSDGTTEFRARSECLSPEGAGN